MQFAAQLSQGYSATTKILVVENMYFLPSLVNLESAVGGPIEDLKISGVESLALNGAEDL